MATVQSMDRHRPAGKQPGTLSIIADRLSLHVPRTAFTLSGFRHWVKADDFPERVRVTFIGGEVYLDMSNEEIETHNKVKTEIVRVLSTRALEQDLGTFYCDGVLLTHERARVSNNPDALLVCWTTAEKGRVQMIPRKGDQGQYTEMIGTPDWVLEVVSNSSVQKDTQHLREAYYRAGIPEYWLIDARGEEIVFQILNRRKRGYAVSPNQEGWQRSRTFGASFRLVRERNRLKEWRYRLEIQPD